MATSGGLTVLFVVLQGLLDPTSVYAATWGQKHFFQLAAFEQNGCLPEGFEQSLPAALWVNAMTCRRQHPVDSTVHHSAPVPGVEASTADQRRALYLHCLAQRLNLISDAGIAEDKLDAFIDTLPAEGGLTGLWKRNADLCLRDMAAGLSPGQQAVYLLSCLRQKLAIDCARGTDLLCLRAKSFLSVKFSRSSSELDSPVVWRRCGARRVRENPSAFSNSERTDVDFCPDLLDRAVAIAACALRDTGHASGDVLNTTSVWETLSRGDDQFGSSRRAEVLKRCENSSVDTFARCWSQETPTTAVTSRAHRLAMALQLSP